MSSNVSGWRKQVERIAQGVAAEHAAELWRVDGMAVLLEAEVDAFVIRFWRPKVDRNRIVKLYIDAESMAVRDEQGGVPFTEFVRRECDEACKRLGAA